MDVRAIRRDFPILERTFHGKPLVYLDSAATSQKPRSVIEAEQDFYTRLNANVHRGVYALSEEATDAYESARTRVARFLHASAPEEVVFVRGTTEAINDISLSLSRGFLSRGDRVITTVMEHHSNIVPWHQLREHPGIDLQFVDIDEDGRLKMDDYDRLLTRSTKVVTLTHVSNVLGTVNPIREIADRAHDVGALVVVDAAQSAPHRPVDVQALGADLVAFSGHKTLGPTGIGVLWGRAELLAKLPPAQGGGEMIREVHQTSVGYREPPGRFEAGTPNIAGAHGLARALDYLEGVGWDELRSHERSLARRARERAEAAFGPRLKIFGPADDSAREAVLSFQLDGVHPHDVASLLDAEGIAVRSGHHCAQPLMERLGVPALTRASPYLYNTVEEVDALFDGLIKVDRFFSKATPSSAPPADHPRASPV
ncbi:MAG: cysteine desulfurase [Thermoplasmata archaeon]|nr:cysteine desulfurase [Thermoplasmata archaeon]